MAKATTIQTVSIRAAATLIQNPAYSWFSTFMIPYAYHLLDNTEFGYPCNIASCAGKMPGRGSVGFCFSQFATATALLLRLRQSQCHSLNRQAVPGRGLVARYERQRWHCPRQSSYQQYPPAPHNCLVLVDQLAGGNHALNHQTRDRTGDGAHGEYLSGLLQFQLSQ